MQKFMRIAGTILCLCIMAASHFWAVSCASRLKACERTAMILMESSPLTLERVRQMQDLEAGQEIPGSFTAWEQKNEISVTNKDLQRNRTVSAVVICGRSDLILRGTSWLDDTDKNGCLIDEKTAYELFGSTDIAGQIIYIGGKEKVVRGILYDVSNAVLYEEDDSMEKFTNIAVYMEKGITYDDVRQDFMSRHGLTGKFVRIDILERIANLACIRFGIPDDLIPTKWSDFNFWSEALEREKESFLLLMLTEKQKPLEVYMKDFYPAVGYGLLSVVTAVIILRKIWRKIR